MSTGKRSPTCQSLLMCDRAYRLAGSDGFILVNVFHQLMAPAFPFGYPSMSAYYTTTDGEGIYDVLLSMEHAESGREVLRATGRLEMTDPLRMYDTVLALRNLVFPWPGKYWVDLRFDGQLMAQRPFFVKVRAPITPGDAEPR